MPNPQHAIGLAAFLLLTGVTAEAHAQRATQAASSQPTVTAEEAAEDGSGEGLEGDDAVPEARTRIRAERAAKARSAHHEESQKRRTVE